MRAVSNQKIADVLQEISLILQAEGVSFKPQAYAAAAQTIRSQDVELHDLYRDCGIKCLDELPGIGKSIAEKIKEMLETGRCTYYEDLKKDYPLDLLAFSQIRDLGPKTAVELYRRLKIKTLAELKKAAQQGKIAKLEGFGEKKQAHILEGLKFSEEHRGRYLLHEIYPLATRIVEELRRVKGVTHAHAAGSIARMKETVGDVDLLATGQDTARIIQAFKKLPEVRRIREEGETMVVADLQNGIECDLRIVKTDEYGSALLYFSGSKEHNIDLRNLAIKKGMKLSEYGLFKGKKSVAGKTEAEVYKALGLPYIPPELREWPDVIDVARKEGVPDLVGYDDIKGDLQVQTKWTDGDASIADMAAEAKRRGLSYIAITDHTKSLTIAGGLDEKKLKAQGKEIDALNKKLDGFRVLKSTECDVLKDGSLDLSDEALKTLDLVAISVHSHTNMSANEMTNRIIHAMSHPLVDILFHPTGRIVNRRAAYAVDVSKIIRAAKEYGVALEVNGSDRLDLKETYVREAIEHGVKLVVDSDAHHLSDFDNLRYGIGQARRGFATKKDVLNTMSVKDLLEWFS